MPLFPLETVLFPGVVMPLRIFEPRYRQLVQDLQDGPEPRAFGIVGLRSGSGVGANNAQDLFNIGCVAQLRRVKPYEDGSSDIVVVGTSRFRLNSVVSTDAPYVVGDTDLLGEREDDAELTEQIAAKALVSFASYMSKLSTLRRRGGSAIESEALPRDPRALSWLIASAAILPRAEKQGLLEIESDLIRLRTVNALLRREIGLIVALRALPVDAREIGGDPSDN